MKMFRAALALVTLFTASAAQAADFGGFRAGLTLGVTEHTAGWTDVDYAEYGGTLATPYTGLSYGIAAGYDLQLGATVVGAELTFDLSTMEKETPYTDSAAVRTDAFKNLAMLRARAGLALDELLLFFTVGIARPTFDHAFVYVPANALNDWKEFSNRKVGFTYGLGVERAVLGGLSVRVEYAAARFPLVDEKNLNNENMQVDDRLEGFRLGVDYRF